MRGDTDKSYKVRFIRLERSEPKWYYLPKSVTEMEGIGGTHFAMATIPKWLYEKIKSGKQKGYSK